MRNILLTVRVAFLLLCCSITPFVLQAQLPFQIEGYAEVYYSYDFAAPSSNARPEYFYTYGRHNEIALNIAMLKASYADRDIRGNIAFMTGTYAQANLATEDALFRHLFEANIGVRLAENIWLDAGVFPSHIGMESAIGADCPTLSRSLAAENSPYYESGAKLTYTSPDGTISVSALVLNGWQRIQRKDGYSRLSFGHDVVWQPTEDFSLKSSSFIGHATPDSLNTLRIFHHASAQIAFSESLKAYLVCDIGAQEKRIGTGYEFWITPAAMLQWRISPTVAVCGRAEYYADPDNIIVTPMSGNSFQVMATSFNVDISVSERVLWRTEVRYLQGKAPIFLREQEFTRDNSVMTTMLAIKL